MAHVDFSLTIESVPVDTISLFVQLAADTVSAYKEIDELYTLDSARFYRTASQSRYYNHPSFTSGGVEREIYARKYLGLLLTATEEGRDSAFFARVFAVMSKRWTRLHDYLSECEEVDLSEVVDPKYQANTTTKPPINNLLSGVTAHYLKSFLAIYPALDMPHQAALKYALFAACALGRKIAVINQEMLTEIQALTDKAPTTKEFQAVNRRLNAPDFKKIARNLKNAIYQKVVPDSHNPWDNDRLIEGWAHCGAYLSSAEGLSLVQPDFRTPPKERDVELLCRLYFIKIAAEWFRYEHVSRTIEEVEMECAEFVMFGLVCLRFLREYKKARRYYLTNNADHLLGEMNALQEKSFAFEEKLRKANDDIAAKSYLLSLKEKEILEQARQHKREVDSLTKEIERLKANAARDAKFEAEEAALARAAQSGQIASPLALVAPDTQSDLAKLKNVRAVVIGGTERWQARLSCCLPHFVYLYGDTGFDEALIINTDIVFADIRFKFDHSYYYRLADIVRRYKKRLVFLSKTNTALTLHQMAAALDEQAPALSQTSIV